MSPAEEAYYDRRAQEEAKRKANVAKLMKRSRTRFRRTKQPIEPTPPNTTTVNTNNPPTTSNPTQHTNIDRPSTTTTTTTTTPTPTTSIPTRTTNNNTQGTQNNVQLAMQIVFDTSESEYSYSISHDSDSHYSDYHNNTSVTFKPVFDVNNMLPNRLRPRANQMSQDPGTSSRMESPHTPSTPLSTPLLNLGLWTSDFYCTSWI